MCPALIGGSQAKDRNKAFMCETKLCFEILVSPRPLTFSMLKTLMCLMHSVDLWIRPQITTMCFTLDSEYKIIKTMLLQEYNA